MPHPQIHCFAHAVFISDLHLCPSLAQTTQAFFSFLQWLEQARVPNLFILGDLFEYWAGDDDLTDPYNCSIAQGLKNLAANGIQIWLMHGNRDVLLGAAFAQACGGKILPDPSVLRFGSQTVLLSHGDAYCTDDITYQQFRQQVRQAAWQEQFLALPLAQRKHIIQNMRSESEIAKQGKSMSIMDVNQQAINAAMQLANVHTMIHGHTHRPAVHKHANTVRYVLPDWEQDSAQPRAGYLEFKDNQFQLRLIPFSVQT